MQIHIQSGWSPILALVADGNRKVLQVIGYLGGTGTTPATGLYIGANGYTADITQAVNVSSAGQEPVSNEIPGGIIDGINSTFTTQFVFKPLSTNVFINGVRQVLNYTYTEGVQLITFSTPPRLDVNGNCKLTIDYLKN